jgi:hypothetical protein
MARRRFFGNLGRPVTIAEFQQGPVLIADPMRVEMELREIYALISHGDPLTDVQGGNFDEKNILFTTPAAINTELPIAHGMDRIPKGYEPRGAAVAGYHYCGSLYATQTADNQYLYLAIRRVDEVNLATVIAVW